MGKGAMARSVAGFDLDNPFDIDPDEDVEEMQQYIAAILAHWTELAEERRATKRYESGKEMFNLL